MGATVLLIFMAAFLWQFGRRLAYDRGAGKPSTNAAARLVLKIDGMDCVMCAAGLQNTLRAVPGVRRADVSFQHKQAVVEYDPAMVDAAHFEKLIADSGFKVAWPVRARP